MRPRVFAAVVAGCVALLMAAVRADDAVPARLELRVCADPSNMPLSNQSEEGFENRIATLLGDRLGLPVVYTWWPNTIGFFRNTLRAKKCDLVMGVVEGFELAATTAPYYRSTYVMVYRSDSGLTLTGLDDPALRDLAIAVVANTPPVDLLVKYGLLDRVRPYSLVVDTRVETPVKEMIEDVASSTVDVALAWGPIASYHAKQQVPPLTVILLDSEAGQPPFAYSISAAVRHGESEWKQTIETLLADNRAEISAILAGHGVPLLEIH
jgi:quinoprotein dehydrogenase-associated probable ABC transporter substrate-binding protein